ncbi:hypothetical protein BpJC7_08020 [Weizmannia acidilactici]|uniref:Uncharacterized protein n=1 Tax=Weizmannia acidilactici TaxID=2607726 RepID=A0A5J4JDU6_9BACI|nr:hypothetical protein [Weizmannia acidilactici]GER66355.1 hypothetical protein BpJC4_08260 [Weizmannia acidilactici]GER69499.1 hypothetical protein BpJC7_08020 [Weizmannia acidilactici]GER73036.1 hypothetical protein BpPP18_11030 [Weizmannia acidilactici]
MLVLARKSGGPVYFSAYGIASGKLLYSGKIGQPPKSNEDWNIDAIDFDLGE